ncbi:MAG: hypothetical protein QOF89_1053 [Acidobacteriota bacterium]|jgi:hypothetical protein|nr:hypothetical protein [Acidobacteriota bacterium]
MKKEELGNPKDLLRADEPGPGPQPDTDQTKASGARSGKLEVPPGEVPPKKS